MTAAQHLALLSALSSEFLAMRGTVDRLETLVLDHARTVAAVDRASVLVQAQAVDALGQRLQALHDLSRALAEGGAVAAAIDLVPLADLADPLRQSILEVEAAPAASPATPGALTLFD